MVDSYFYGFLPYYGSGHVLTTTVSGWVIDSSVPEGLFVDQLQTSNGVVFGTAVSTTVNSGGFMDVRSGGTASGIVVNSGGTAQLESSSIALNVVVNGGGVFNDLGTVNGVVINAGGLETVGVSDSPFRPFDSGASVFGTQYIANSGTAVGAIVFSGGGQIVSYAGVANTTTVGAGGSQVVSDTGVSNETTVSNGGSEIVAANGIANSTTVGSGGSEIVSYGLSSDTIVLNGGSETVVGDSFEGKAIDTIVSSGGTEVVSSGGESIATTLEDGGILLVSSSGLISGTELGEYDSGGPVTITNDGAIDSSLLEGTGVDLTAGGTIDNGSPTATQASIVGYAYGVDISDTPATLSNYGTIQATGTAGVGVRLIPGGSFSNAPNALILGAAAGIYYGADPPVTTGLFGAYGGQASSPGTIINHGTVEATVDNAIVLISKTAAVANYGTITATGTKGGTVGLGIAFTYGGFVTNSSAGLIRGYLAAVSAAKGPATITNAGTLYGIQYGVRLNASGSITNTNSGTIASYGIQSTGIIANNTVAYIANFGMVMAPGSSSTKSFASGTAIKLTAGGTVRNHATIQGAAGVALLGTYGALYNYGTVVASLNNGVNVNVSARITNSSPTSVITAPMGSAISLSGPGPGGGSGASAAIVNFGRISGKGGIIANAYISAAITVRNFGTITGTYFDAIQFRSPGGRLIEFPQGHIYGVVAGGGGTLELGPGAQAGSIAGLGSSFTGFSALQFDPGTPWTAEGSAAGFPGTITGFGAGDTIDVDGFVAVSETFANNALVLTNSASSQVTLGIQGALSTSNFTITPDDDGGTYVTAMPCFCRGTRILTPRGEVVVEELAIGDRVLTISGVAKPIRWIGHRAYDGRFAAANRAVMPIRIAAGALTDGVPARDLLVSPEHALYLDDVLVPAGRLANGATIRQVESVEWVEYFHIELATHDVLLAEGAPAETFVDCDNRLMFQNGAEFAVLYPDDASVPWDFCAPRVAAGSPELIRIRAALLARTAALGYGFSDDPDLHLVADGAVIRAQAVAAEVYRFTVPAGARAVAIASRSVVPAETEAVGGDMRRLGVAVERIIFCDADLRIEAEHSHAALCDGFHADEGSHRWTDGMARLPESWLRAFPGGVALEVHLAVSGLAYRVPSPARIAA